MAEQLTITITARDGASQTFRAVGQSATQMGQAIDRAGIGGVQGMRDLGTSADTAGRSMERLKAEATAIGAIMGTLATGVIAVGTAFREQERQIDGINRLYGDQADIVLEMAENIQDFTRYSNDAARESALLASSLISNYDLSAEQLSILIERSADLAQIYGFTLPDAVQRTAGAIRGEGEAAERLGLNMSDAAIAARALEAGITNWNVPGALSEAERAAFRFQVFLEDTEATVGAAAAAADTAGGSFRQFLNEVQDAGQAVGGFLGPIGEVGAELAPLALLAPAVGAGLGRMSAAMAAAGTSATALAASVSLFTAALGAGALTGVGIGGFLGEFVTSLRDGEGALKAFSDATNILQAALGELRSGDVIGFFDTLINGIDDASTSMEAFNKTLSGFLTEAARQTVLGNDEIAASLEALVHTALRADSYAETRLNDAEWMRQQTAIQVEATGRTISQSEQDIRDAMTLTDAELAVREEAMRTIAEAYLQVDAPVAEMNAAIAELDAQLHAGTITTDEHTQGLVELAREYGDLPNDIQSATDALASMDSVAKGAGETLATLPDALSKAQEEAARLAAEQQKAREEWIASALAVGGYDTALSALNMTGLTGDMGMLAENLTRAGAAFENTFRVLVTNVQGIGQGVQQATDWMAELTVANEEGIVTVNRLAEAQRITWGEAEAAVTAYNQTLAANADIQDNLLAIQAMQAPFVAEQVAATQAYVAELAAMDAATQRTTLAFMDLQTVQQAQELITLGNSAAFDQMGDSGRAAFEATIQGALQVNPLLFNVLETMGIISGTPMDFEVDYSALEGAGSAIEQLTTQVGHLVDTLREIYGLPPIDVEANVEGVEEAQTQLSLIDQIAADIDGTAANLTIDAETGEASFTIGNIVDQLAEVDGATATATVSVQMAGAAELAGGGLAGLRDQLNIPETIETTVSVTGADEVIQAGEAIDALEDRSVSVSIDVAGWEQIGSLFDMIRAAGDASITVSIDADTGDLDAALAGLGIGDGGGGGGAAGFDGPSITVMVDANVGEAQMKIDQLGVTGEKGARDPISIMVDADTTQAASDIMALLTLTESATVTVQVDALTDSALTSMGAVQGVLAGLNGATSTVVVNGDNSNALAAVATAAGAIGGIAGMSAMTFVLGDPSGAIGAAGAAAGAIASVDGMTATGYLTAVNNVGGAVAAAISALDSFNGRTATAYINVVQTGAAGLGAAVRHGGIPELATGGVLFRGGEAGPELAHFAGGGTAWLPQDAMYLAPPMTMISPAPASKSAMGAGIHIDFSGATFVGTSREEMDRWAEETLLPVMAAELQRHQVATGVR